VVEGLYLSEVAGGVWRAMLKNLGRGGVGKRLKFVDAPQVEASVIGQGEGGIYDIHVESGTTALELLSRIGRMPLPPYIRRQKEHDPLDDADRQRYQTVYAKTEGSVAAPTAGLHFTPAVLSALEAKGVQRVFLTLHVGLGTFKPITSDTLEGHPMHSEAYSIPSEAADMLNRAKSEGRRIIAVGTTAARVLESQPEGAFLERNDQTSIFIYPPYPWKHVSALITNFHLPRSTLIALVAAMVGLDEQRRIYRAAIEQRYRFFSYGDAMFIE